MDQEPGESDVVLDWYLVRRNHGGTRGRRTT